MLGRFGQKKRALSDFDEEIQSHIEFEIEELKQDGLDEEEARYAAMRKFGNVTITRERFYESGRWLWLDALVRNLSFAFRLMRHRPLSTLAIIVLLALGTGGVTAVFNPIYSQIFAPLPFPQPEQLMLIGGDIPLFNLRFNRFEREEELERIFSNLASYVSIQQTLETIPGVGKNKVVHAVYVTEDFFETLGVLPLRGSSFKHGAGCVVSNRFWRNELMGAEDVIGKPLTDQFLIVGIMPETFDFPMSADIWMYNGPRGAYISPERQYLGRLRPGVFPGKAEEELRVLDLKSGMGLEGHPGPVLQSLKKVFYGDRRPMLWMLGSAAVLFLLLVCAGVMNLLATQGALRRSEMAMRQAFGATRRRLVFQLLCETLPLVIAGALGGLWLSEIAKALLLAQFPALRGGEVVVPVKMAFFATLVLAVTIIGGLIPALYVSAVDLNTYLKSGTNFRRRFFSFSLRELLTGMQFSLALALLTGIGLLISSMMFHADVPIRWSSRDLAVVKADFLKFPMLPEAVTSHAMFFREFHNHLSTMPEVVNAGIFNPIPFSADAARAGQVDTGVYKTLPTEQERVFTRAIRGWVSPEGFEMLEIPLISGRPFSQIDLDNAVAFERANIESIVTAGIAVNASVGGVAIVNQSLARQFWPGENAVGKTIYDERRNSHEIVGVVQDVHLIGDNKEFVAAVYYPVDNYRRSQTYLVKLHSGALLEDFRRRLSGFDAGPVTIELSTLSEVVSESMANTRMTLQLLGCFALLGIVIAGLGVYATTSLMAAARTHEMGIRMAMGAQTWDILGLALWRGMRAILLGVPFGLFLAWILSRVLSSFLFQIKTDDLFAWAVSCLVLLAITTVAALIPALRAARVNPLDALRE